MHVCFVFFFFNLSDSKPIAAYLRGMLVSKVSLMSSPHP